MTETGLSLPAIADNDGDDVALALQTAHALWRRADQHEAVRWLRRAAAAASENGDDLRSVALATAAADLTSELGLPRSVAPGPPSTNGSSEGTADAARAPEHGTGAGAATEATLESVLGAGSTPYVAAPDAPDLQETTLVGGGFLQAEGGEVRPVAPSPDTVGGSEPPPPPEPVAAAEQSAEPSPEASAQARSVPPPPPPFVPPAQARQLRAAGTSGGPPAASTEPSVLSETGGATAAPEVRAAEGQASAARPPVQAAPAPAPAQPAVASAPAKPPVAASNASAAPATAPLVGWQPSAAPIATAQSGASPALAGQGAAPPAAASQAWPAVSQARPATGPRAPTAPTAVGDSAALATMPEASAGPVAAQERKPARAAPANGSGEPVTYQALRVVVFPPSGGDPRTLTARILQPGEAVPPAAHEALLVAMKQGERLI